jgi:CBS domain-containing membrane protein
MQTRGGVPRVTSERGVGARRKSSPRPAGAVKTAREASASAATPIRVRDVMSTPVEFLEVGDSLDLARHLMQAGRIRHLPVVDSRQRVIGLVTHRKLLAAWVGHGDPAHERPADIAREIPVDMLMETSVFTTTPDALAAKAAQIIETRKIGCLPVVEGGRLIGIVTEADFVRFARQVLEPRRGGHERRR